MSYFPDYRKETDKLNDVDKAFMDGYRKAVDGMKCFFENIDEDDLYTFEKEVIVLVEKELDEWMQADENETVCALFNEADYLPEDIELVDANKSINAKEKTMENTIAELKSFFEDAIANSEVKGEHHVQTLIPLKDLRILKEILERSLHLKDKCVATEEKKLDVGCKLADTVSGMTSADYKERFKAEYLQTKIRYEKLKAFNTKIEAALATNYRKNCVEMPAFDCPQDMLRDQQRIMGEYLHILEVRAVIEGVDLTSI